MLVGTKLDDIITGSSPKSKHLYRNYHNTLRTNRPCMYEDTSNSAPNNELVVKMVQACKH